MSGVGSRFGLAERPAMAVYRRGASDDVDAA